jgi:hypothetical protein
VQLQVPELVLCPHPLAALHATGATTGLVLDVGHRETRAVAVACGAPLFATLAMVPVGAETVAAEARRLRAEAASGNAGGSACAADALFADPPSTRLAAQGLAGVLLACLDKVPVRKRCSLASTKCR